MSDKIKMALAILLVAAGVVAYQMLPNAAAIVRILPVLAGLAAAAGVALTASYGRAFVVFGRESVAEARKVVWPTRRESLQITGVVILLVLFVAVFMWIVDTSLGSIMGWLLNRGN